MLPATFNSHMHHIHLEQRNAITIQVLSIYYQTGLPQAFHMHQTHPTRLTHSPAPQNPHSSVRESPIGGLFVPVVQENYGEDKEGDHAGEGGSVVRVGGHQKPLELVVLEVANLDLLGELDVGEAQALVVNHKLENAVDVGDLEMLEKPPLQGREVFERGSGFWVPLMAQRVTLEAFSPL
jgi:hypothetical protein